MALAAQHTSERSQRSDRLHCGRCGGLMVREFCSDLLNGADLECRSTRCVQCGDLLDAVIMRNRRRQVAVATI